eukprot:935461-Pyramimonas_sp.AAC.1
MAAERIALQTYRRKGFRIPCMRLCLCPEHALQDTWSIIARDGTLSRALYDSRLMNRGTQTLSFCE